jgi:hypothetical protein
MAPSFVNEGFTGFTSGHNGFATFALWNDVVASCKDKKATEFTLVIVRTHYSGQYKVRNGHRQAS